MISRRFIIGTIFFVFLVQTYAGYWICDWVNGRGWMYCSRGFCTTFGKKRSLTSMEEFEEDTGPRQNYDATFCFDDMFCYTCETVNKQSCRITLLREDEIFNRRSYAYKKRSDEDLCQ